MPLVLAPFVALVIGVLLGFVPPDASTVAELGRARRVVGLFAVLSFAPAVGYPLWALPDWSFAYLTSASALPSAWTLVLVALVTTGVPLGFELTRRARVDGSPRRALSAGFACAVLGMAVLTGLGGRLLHAGTTAELRGGFALPSLLSLPRGLASFAMSLLLAVAVSQAALALRSPAPATSGRPPPPRRPVAPAGNAGQGAGPRRPSPLAQRR